MGMHKKLLLVLHKYTGEHFNSEENLMQQIGYPKLDEHREIHTQMIEKLSEISMQPLDSEESLYKVKKFFYDWLIDHIMHQDKDYIRFYKVYQKSR